MGFDYQGMGNAVASNDAREMARATDEAAGITRDSSGAIVMSNAAYDRMFSAERGFPQRQEQSEQRQAPEEIYAGRLKAEAQTLDAQMEQATADATKESKRLAALLKNQQRIKWDAMNKDRSLDSEAKEKKHAELTTQYEVQLAAIESKAAPELERIQQIYQNEQRKMQEQQQGVQQNVAMLTQMENDGDIPPEVAESKRIKLFTGQDISPSVLRGEVGNVERRKTILEDDIRDITTFLERFEGSGRVGFVRGALTFAKRGEDRVAYTDPVTDVERVLDPDVSEDARLIDNKRRFTNVLKDKEKEFGRLLVEDDPHLQGVVKKNERRRHARNILAGTSERGGGLGPSFEKKLADNPRTKNTLPPAEETFNSLAEQGLGREQIRKQMTALGYKL